ncbi:glycosyltransferase family 2 protein [Flavobacterium sp.]|uniref:glycosyltransferase family 2 protein n=1 Tax=Flavobacterium sp. TaxID=239 RepID=UPI002C4A1E9C|nr:glycosyltransferase family 2 protein [Flavobacterium sp.]HSD07366.1 glycosyltransferase family 2 protein [Flavobacterium sp.]
MNQPLVSIIIPSYNRAHLIGETLDCVLSQTYANWECIIVDDGSTDETQLLLDHYCKKDDRFFYQIKTIEQKKGASISRNLGLKLSKGEFVQFLDSDDILAPNKIEVQLDLLKKESKYTISTCMWGKFNVFGESLNLIKNSADYKNFDTIKEYFDIIGLHGGFFPPLNFLMPKELINYSGYWNESLTVNDDGEFFFRILSNAEKILFCDKTYVLYRNNSNDNLSVLNAESKALSLVNSWKIIETLYVTKYNEVNSNYINKKKGCVYNELKREYPQLIASNRNFFEQQIKEDTLLKKINKLKKRIKNRLKNVFKF